MNRTFTTSLAQMLVAYDQSEVDFLCDLILEMQGDGLVRCSLDSSEEVGVDVIEVIANAFPSRICYKGAFIIIIEHCVVGDYMYSLYSDEYGGPRKYRLELLNKLIAEFGDVELKFTITLNGVTQ